MSEETRRKLKDVWGMRTGELEDLMAHMRDELGKHWRAEACDYAIGYVHEHENRHHEAEHVDLAPTPAKCEECGVTTEVGPACHRSSCSRATPPSAKGPWWRVNACQNGVFKHWHGTSEDASKPLETTETEARRVAAALNEHASERTDSLGWSYEAVTWWPEPGAKGAAETMPVEFEVDVGDDGRARTRRGTGGSGVT